MARPFEVNELIRRLELEPHPEGGHYRRTWVHPKAHDGRPLASAIIYLLAAGERSHWHRIDAAEMWHHYAGGPLELRVATTVTDGDGLEVRSHRLGGDVLVGEEPQVVVSPGSWQAAAALAEFTLVGCTVTPAFEFEGFELAPPGWQPG